MPIRNKSCNIKRMNWRIGCSGYYYPEWKGIFYPPDLDRKAWFQHYCRHFNTIELNSTFYRFPRLEFLNNWYSNSPDDFVFSVKAPRLITHYKKFRDAKHYLGDFYKCVREGLREKLGAVLFQFPANFFYDENRLEKIIGLTDATFRNVVECRHESWWDDFVFARLKQANLIFAGMDHPSLPARVVQTTPVVYYRFHGAPHLYISSYPNRRLEDVAREIQQLENVHKVFVYFNNTAEGAAVENARQFQEIAELVH